MKGRSYVLIIVLLAAAALIAIAIAVAGTYFLDPEVKEEVERSTAVSQGESIIVINDIYYIDGQAYYPREGCTFAIAYVDVTNKSPDAMKLSASDFKLLSNGESQPIVNCTGFGKTLEKGESIHTVLYYELPEKKAVVKDIEFKYGGSYSISFSVTVTDERPEDE